MLRSLFFLLLAVPLVQAQPRIEGGFDVGLSWTGFDRLPQPSTVESTRLSLSASTRSTESSSQAPSAFAWLLAPIAGRIGGLVEFGSTQRSSETRITLDGVDAPDTYLGALPGGKATVDYETSYHEVALALHGAVTLTPGGVPIWLSAGPYGLVATGAKRRVKPSAREDTAASLLAQEYGSEYRPISLNSGFAWGLSTTLRTTLFRYGGGGISVGLRASHDVSSPLESGRRARSVSALMGVTF